MANRVGPTPFSPLLSDYEEKKADNNLPQTTDTNKDDLYRPELPTNTAPSGAMKKPTIRYELRNQMVQREPIISAAPVILPVKKKGPGCCSKKCKRVCLSVFTCMNRCCSKDSIFALCTLSAFVIGYILGGRITTYLLSNKIISI